MNALKTLVIVALLGAVAYGVYVSITRSPRPASDGGLAPAWPTAGQAQIAGPPGASSQPMPGRPQLGPLTGPIASTGNAASPTNVAPQWPAPGASDPPSGPPAGNGPAGSPPLAASTGPPGGSSFPPPGYPAVADSSPGSTPPPVRGPEDDPGAVFNASMETIQRQLAEGRLDEALRTLSVFYDRPGLSAVQSRQVRELLDQLAGTVIYSRQHVLEPAYQVRAGETLEDIARSYNVPWELLARINGLRDPRDLAPGQQLKVVRGPFGALIDLDRMELTLMLDGRYAGRFPIGLGRDRPAPEGAYAVRERVPAPFAAREDGSKVEANDPDNTLGAYWIGLDGGFGIHGTNDPRNVGRADAPGSICLGSRDLEDVVGILSVGSQVVIRR